MQLFYIRCSQESPKGGKKKKRNQDLELFKVEPLMCSLTCILHKHISIQEHTIFPLVHTRRLMSEQMPVHEFIHVDNNEHELVFRSMLDTYNELLSLDLVVNVLFIRIQPYELCFSWIIYCDRNPPKNQEHKGFPGCLWRLSPQKFVFKGCQSSDIPTLQRSFWSSPGSFVSVWPQDTSAICFYFSCSEKINREVPWNQNNPRISYHKRVQLHFVKSGANHK